MRSHSVWIGLAIVSVFVASSAVDAPPLISYEEVFTDPNVLSSLDAGSKQYPCGDANGDSCITHLDVSYLMDFIYRGGPPPIGDGDVNQSGGITVGDVTFLVAYLYRGGSPPCGVDPPPCPPPTSSPGDTVEIGSASICCSTTVASIPVTLKNSSVIMGMTFTLEYDQNFVAYQSTQFNSTLLQGWEVKADHYPPTVLLSVYTPSLLPGDRTFLSPGTYEIATLSFSSVVDPMLAQDTLSMMDTTFIPPTHSFSLTDTSQVRLVPTFSPGGFDIRSHCGDANGDGCQYGVTVADAVYLVSYCYRSGPAPVCHADVNLDGRLTVADAIYTVGYIYRGGSPPCGPTH